MRWYSESRSLRSASHLKIVLIALRMDKSPTC